MNSPSKVENYTAVQDFTQTYLYFVGFHPLGAGIYAFDEVF